MDTTSVKTTGAMEIDTNTNCDGGGAGAHDYRQLGVLREFGNIANAVSDEDFLSLMRRTTTVNVKWLPMLKCLRERIQQGIAEDWSGMWEEEKMSEKLEALEKQREKFSDASRPEPMWRPQLANVKAQLKANDTAVLRKKKHFLELQAKEYESRVAKLKKSLLPKRGYLRAMQVDIHKCQKKNNELCKNIDELFQKHSELAEEICASSKDDIGCKSNSDAISYF